MMSKIKGKNTKPEIKLRKALWASGFHYRVNSKSLPGKPDISNRKLKIAIFIDGEFWHGYNWEVKKENIKSNRKFWIPKIERNIQRDKENTQKLKNMGYVVIRFWANEVNNELGTCVKRVLDALNDR